MYRRLFAGRSESGEAAAAATTNGSGELDALWTGKGGSRGCVQGIGFRRGRPVDLRLVASNGAGVGVSGVCGVVEDARDAGVDIDESGESAGVNEEER